MTTRTTPARHVSQHRYSEVWLNPVVSKVPASGVGEHVVVVLDVTARPLSQVTKGYLYVPIVTARLTLPKAAGIIPWWRTDEPTLNGQSFLDIDTGGEIRGFTRAGGNPVEGAVVSLFYTPTNAFIRSTVSAADGYFVFSGLDRLVSDYFVLARKPTMYAQVFDAVQPL